MRGYYFHNMDVQSTRAHACQILNTTSAINSELSLRLVLPRYGKGADFDALRSDHDLGEIPGIILLPVFGIRSPSLRSFILFNLPAMAFLLREKMRGRVDFLYFRFSYLAPVALLAFILRIPFFYETHRRPISRSELLRDWIMSRLATGIIVISEYMKEHYVPYGKAVLVAHDAVSLKRFSEGGDKREARKKFGIGEDIPVCIYTGTVSKLKGADYLIAAARLLPGVRFLLAGIIASEFADAELPPNVTLLGRLQQREIPELLRAADVLLLPHPRTEYSQSPMKLFEYMASEVPIVASRLPCHTEVLDDTSAILVEPEDVGALARGIEKVLGDPRLAQAIARKARTDVEAYTWEKRGAAIAGFIKETMKHCV